LTPIARIINIGQEISDLKWILNDTFLIVITKSNQVITFDSLLYAFNIATKSSYNKSL